MRNLVVALVVVACGPALSLRAECVPGASAPCACMDGREGRQLCVAVDRYEACVCAGSDDAGARDSPLGALDGGSATPDHPAALARSDGAPDTAAASQDVPVVPLPCRGTMCGTTCVPALSASVDHCGACFRRCRPLADGGVAACSEGACVHRCRGGLVTCGPGACVDPSAPGFRCASCGSQCADGLECQVDAGVSRCVRR